MLWTHDVGSGFVGEPTGRVTEPGNEREGSADGKGAPKGDSGDDAGIGPGNGVANDVVEVRILVFHFLVGEPVNGHIQFQKNTVCCTTPFFLYYFVMPRRREFLCRFQ